MTLDEVDHRVREVLAGLGVRYELIPCDPGLADTAEFCAAYGYSLDESANTILVQGKVDPAPLAACVLLATTRLDVNRTVRTRLGVKKASFADPDTTMAATGMATGGVTPFALPEGLPIWVDRRVTALPRIVLGGGSRNWKVVGPPTLLTALPDVEIVDGLAIDVPAPSAG
ncbi:MAG TPA: YbaK/EbsC family protein [Acidimicrobiales bacterium]|nr:YbaK/EbsC family protein [Acidimicrobiales bacterium]